MLNRTSIFDFGILFSRVSQRDNVTAHLSPKSSDDSSVVATLVSLSDSSLFCIRVSTLADDFQEENLSNMEQISLRLRLNLSTMS